MEYVDDTFEGDLLEEAYRFAERAQEAPAPPEGPSGERIVAKTWNAASELPPRGVEVMRKAITNFRRDIQQTGVEAGTKDDYAHNYLERALSFQILALQKSLVYRSLTFEFGSTPVYSELGQRDRDRLDCPSAERKKELRSMAEMYEEEWRAVQEYYDEISGSGALDGTTRKAFVTSALQRNGCQGEEAGVEARRAIEKWRRKWPEDVMPWPETTKGLAQSIHEGVEAFNDFGSSG